MSDKSRSRRGGYAKGIAKREEILTRALDVIANEGYRGASVKELAAAVGLSQAGLLHHFESKDELFAEILRKRDEVDAEHYGGPVQHEGNSLEDVRAGFLGILRHNSQVPGLVELFSRMAVDAAASDHVAHDFFLDRGASRRALLSHTFRAAQQSGDIPASVDPDTLARLFQAVADGLQLQWMLDRDVDMARIAGALFDLLTIPGEPDVAVRQDGSHALDARENTDLSSR